MRTFDLNALRIEIKNLKRKNDDIEFEANVRPVLDEEAFAIAYIRLPKNVRTFLLDCYQRYGVLGFTYDFIQQDTDLGVILKVAELEEMPMV